MIGTVDRLSIIALVGKYMTAYNQIVIVAESSFLCYLEIVLDVGLVRTTELYFGLNTRSLEISVCKTLVDFGFRQNILIITHLYYTRRLFVLFIYHSH